MGMARSLIGLWLPLAAVAEQQHYSATPLLDDAFEMDYGELQLGAGAEQLQLSSDMVLAEEGFQEFVPINFTTYSFQCGVASDQEYHLCRNLSDPWCGNGDICITKVDQMIKVRDHFKFYGSCCCSPVRYPFLKQIIKAGWSIHIRPIISDHDTKGSRPWCEVLACQRPMLARSVRITEQPICCDARYEVAGLTLEEVPCCGSPKLTDTDTCCTHDVGQVCGLFGLSWLKLKQQACCLDHPGWRHCSVGCQTVTPSFASWCILVVVGSLLRIMVWSTEADDYFGKYAARATYPLFFVLFWVSGCFNSKAKDALYTSVPGVLLVLLIPKAWQAQDDSSIGACFHRKRLRSRASRSGATHRNFACFMSFEDYAKAPLQDDHIDTLCSIFREAGWQGAEAVWRDLTQQDLLQRLREIGQRVKGCPNSEDVTIFIYISAHGLRSCFTDHILCPDSWFRGVSWPEMRKALDVKHGGGPTVVIFFNACRSPSKGLPWLLSFCALSWFHCRNVERARMALRSHPRMWMVWSCAPSEFSYQNIATEALVDLLQDGMEDLSRILGQPLQNKMHALAREGRHDRQTLCVLREGFPQNRPGDAADEHRIEYPVLLRPESQSTVAELPAANMREEAEAAAPMRFNVRAASFMSAHEGGQLEGSPDDVESRSRRRLTEPAPSFRSVDEGGGLRRMTEPAPSFRSVLDA